MLGIYRARMIECGPGERRRMGRSRAQYGEKKQCDRGYRAHEIPLLKTDIKRLATTECMRNWAICKGCAGHNHDIFGAT